MGVSKAVRQPIIETRKISKNFGATQALDGVDVQVYCGQITGLIGENGSGKSTILSIMAGMQPASMGEMLYKGEPYNPASMIDAAAKGVGMIVQEQGYVPGITVAQNIFLGEEGRFRTAGFISKHKMNQEAQKALDGIGFKEVDPSVYIDSLDMQSRKLVEIAKVMYMNPDVLMVDETTTALSQEGREILYGIMDRMKKEGKAVIFISHDLEELMYACDTLTVLRDGKKIATLEKHEMIEQDIKRLMVGREMGEHYYRTDYDPYEVGEVVLDVDNVTSSTGLLMNFSTQVRKGEILGIGGLSHCGMHELGRVLFGEEKFLRGSVTHVASGKKITGARCALKLGLGYVSKDRDLEALVLTASIKDNIVSAGLDMVTDPGFFILAKTEKDYVMKQVDSLSIKCASINQDVQYLSGGNKQKVSFSKWIARDCDILVLDCPTRGVDIGVKAAMYQLMHEMKQAGKTIIMISEELPELIGMSDRLLILKNGKLAEEFLRSPDLSEQVLIEYMI